jgi:hypothetical protein
MTVPRELHIGSALDSATLDSLADFICGDDGERFPTYRSSSYLTRFFSDINIDAVHDGSTRKWWVLDILKQLPPAELERAILRLVDPRIYRGKKDPLGMAVRSMNEILAMDNLGIGFIQNRPVLTDGAPITFDIEDLKREPLVADAEAFLEQQFSDDIRIDDLKVDTVISGFLQSRINEVQAIRRDKAPLATIFLLGSTLEGILIAVACNDIKRFMTAQAAPKDKSQSVLKIQDWTLNSLIDVAHQIGMLSLDVKKFSHVLRDFRNYIHPYRQMSEAFSPDQDTVDICWQVFKAAVSQLKESSKNP